MQPPPPAFGRRLYHIDPGGVELVEEIHQFHPGQGEDEGALLQRIVRALGLPLAVEIRYQQGRMAYAEARRTS